MNFCIFSVCETAIRELHLVLPVPTFGGCGLVNYCSYSIEDYNGRLDKLTIELLELCAQGLGLTRDTFTKPFNGTAGDCIARMNYYPPCPLSALTLGLGAHTDPNLLTILSQCKVGGLQVCKNGTWISVKPKPDTLIINVGDSFEVCVFYHFLEFNERGELAASHRLIGCV